MRVRELLCLTVAISVVATLAGCSTSTNGPGDGGRSALDGKKAEALDVFHLLWPALVAAGDANAAPPTAQVMREQCADDGSTMAYSVSGWVNNATANTHADVVRTLADILTQHGWAQQKAQSSNQAFRFTKSDAFVELYANPDHDASPGHYAFDVRSSCAAVSDDIRRSQPPAETLT